MKIKYILLMIILSFSAVFAYTQNIYAASDPFCFTQAEGSASYREINCADWAATVSLVTGKPLSAGMCYGIALGVEVKPIAQCQDVIAKTTEQATNKPECYKYSGKIQNYYNGSAKNSDIQTVNCDDSVKAVFAANQQGFNFNSDTCYVVGVGNETSSKPCKEHDSLISQSTQKENNGSAEALKNTNRQKVQNCEGEKCITENPLVVLVKAIVNFVSVLVAVIVVIMIIVGGIQYASAGGNPNKVAEAKNRITNAILAFVMYIFLFAFLQWLLPGGVLK